MNEIVSYHNNLSNLGLKQFTATELDIFMAVCYKCKAQGIDELSFTFEEIKSLGKYKAKDNARFIKDLINTNRKLLNLNMAIYETGTITQFVLFTRFRINPEKEVLEIKVNDEFSYILNNLTSNFTRFELSEFAALKSVYAKSCYRQLKRYRDTGFWEVSLEEFKNLLDIPASYETRTLNRRVLPPIQKELSPIFTNLHIEIKYNKGRGKPVGGYRFTWKVTARETSTQPKMIDSGYKKTSFKCPYCKEELVEKMINGNNCWCHLDGWKEGAKCNAIFNSVAEIEGYSEKPTREDYEKTAREDDYLSEEEKKEYMNKMREKLSKAF